ncbi:FAS1 domain-containing protein [Glomus cerebriforme]|uniref:FAS1 domain-containing protein n=1 Tax=Glomus cerebriforme TaxID=658196 RepID=A0A397SDK9_9GLOM|nr:FAS1 domain-containing protein [Glomus cerebriforme]
MPTFVTILSSAGPYTFFAPNNIAIENLNAATPDQIELLLYHHLIPGKLLTTNIPTISYPNSMLMVPPSTIGEPIVVEKLTADGIKIGSGLTSSSVLVFDQVASNGVIHIVDTVLAPPMSPIQVLLQSSSFTSMIKILQTESFGNLANEITKISDEGITILALTNDAIANVPKGVANNLNLINPIFSYHIIPKNIIYSGSIEIVVSATTLENEIITFTRDSGNLYAGNVNVKAKIINADLITHNGVIHVIDNILIPQSVQTQLTSENNTSIPLPLPSPSSTNITPKPSENPSPSPTETSTKISSSNVGIIVGSALGGIVGGGFLMLGGFFLIYKGYFTKKQKSPEELFPYYYNLDVNNNTNSQPSHSHSSHYSNSNSNDDYSIPTTNQTNHSVYVGNE